VADNTSVPVVVAAACGEFLVALPACTHERTCDAIARKGEEWVCTGTYEAEEEEEEDTGVCSDCLGDIFGMEGVEREAEGRDMHMDA